MIPVVLRSYQSRDAEAIRDSYRRGKKAPLYVAPCGAGKTVLFSYICESAVKRGKRVLILAHRVELIDQISSALTLRGIQHGYIAGGYRFIEGYDVYVANVFSLIRRTDLFHPDLIIADEAHHIAPTWSGIYAANQRALRLGVTATPVGPLAKYFDDLIIGPTYEELTSEGYLCPIRIYAPPTIDTSGLHSRAGEYIPTERNQRSDKPSVTGDVINHYKQHCEGRLAIVFDVSVDGANRRAESFRAAGIPSECIDGTLAREIRRDRIASFQRREVRVLTSVDLVEEGFDLPAIEVGIDLCPTQSLRRYRQRAGRLLRPMDGKHEALYFDHAGNCLRHGFPNEQLDWELSEDGPRAGSAKSLAPRVCQKCFAVSPAGARTCRACAEPFPVEPRKVAHRKGDLEEITPEQLQKKVKRKNQGRAQTEESLIELYYIRQRGKGPIDPEKAKRWAGHILEARRAKGLM